MSKSNNFYRDLENVLKSNDSKNNSAEKARMNMKAKKTKWSISLSLFTLTLF
jgi:hypothetical protein